MAALSYVGQSVKRREDPRLITGAGIFTDDVEVQASLHVAFVRSPHAHARIVSIDTSAAAAAPGVIAVVAGRDVLDVPPVPPGFVPPTAPAVPLTPILPAEKVTYVGQAVAAVAAEDPYAAADAAELVQVEYEPLPAVSDPVKALEKDAPQIYANVPGNAAFTMMSGSDDVEAALKEADEVVTIRVVNNRLAPITLENRAALAQYDAFDQGLTISLATQTPHSDRASFAQIVGVPENRIRLLSKDVGGGFGAKGNVYPEEAIVALLAKRLRRTVRWSDSRGENMRTMTHGRGHITELTLGVKRDGTLTALDTKVISDVGGVLHPIGAASVGSIMGMCPGPYRISKARARATAVYTNCAPVGPYRGAGRPEATYALERAVDAAARAIGMDPVELRRKNLLNADEFPYTTPTGPVYDSGDYHKALDLALKEVDYDGLRAEQQRLRAQGRYMGIGVTTFVEPAGALFWEYCELRVERTGTVTLYTGS
ncbi:MAG: xanthine dehydrogenase family protein, partial [Chloroflexota bacterium]|nr:xanthine dehydrogenase family protein [Chloroflexota bacterium]